jgi:hypothetical protein
MLIVLLCFIPILFLPLIAGIAMFWGRVTTDLHLMAAILTLKPVFLTPIWFAIMRVFEISHPTLGKILGILPAIIVTGLVIVKFHSLLFGYEVRQAAWFLIMLDILRWMSTLLLSFEPSGNGKIMSSMYLASISAPTIFAIVASVIVARENARPPRKQKRAEV